MVWGYLSSDGTGHFIKGHKIINISKYLSVWTKNLQLSVKKLTMNGDVIFQLKYIDKIVASPGEMFKS